MTPVGFLLSASLILLVVALLLSLVRLIVGPTPLDRAISLDVFAAGVVAIVSVLIVLEGRYDLAALLIVFVLTAFFSTVTVARFVGMGQGRDPRRKVTTTTAEDPVVEADGNADEGGGGTK